MNTKFVIVLPVWPQFKAATFGLRLLRQIFPYIPISRCLLNRLLWAIDKDTHVKVLPTHVKSMVSSLVVGNANNKSKITSHWLPIAATLTITDPNQLDPPIKLPIYIAHDSLQYHTSVLINSTTY